MHDVPLVIWVNSPPFVERGAFEFLDRNWPGGVVYAILGELRAERAAMGWDDAAAASNSAIRLRGTKPISVFCHAVVSEFPLAMHLVGGLSSSTGSALSRLVSSAPPERVAVFSERPGVYGPLAERAAKQIVHPIKYRWLVRRFRHRVGLLLPLGEVGVRMFSRYGWPAEKMAPFMYCPPLLDVGSVPLCADAGPARFLYVGRLSRYAKGTDVLLRAAERLHGEWNLTLVGGHGDMVDHVNKWAAARPNVDVVGAATPEDVRAAMARHHVCVVPSRVDGWNVVVNESLYAGRGVITTDKVASDEMISVSGAGQVVEARSATRLAAAMQQVIDDRSLASEWARRAVRYSPLISPVSVGGYLLELLQALSAQSEPLRQAPWLRDMGDAG